MFSKLCEEFVISTFSVIIQSTVEKAVHAKQKTFLFNYTDLL